MPDGQQPDGLGGAARAYLDKVRGWRLRLAAGRPGVAALVILFGTLKGDRFLSSFNFANLVGQSAMIVVIAMGLIFVLLLGEIDLAAGVTAGMCAAVLGVAMTEHGWPLPLGLGACLLTGVVVGLAQGVLVANWGIPSFVVTPGDVPGLPGRAAADHRRGWQRSRSGTRRSSRSRTTTCPCGPAGCWPPSWPAATRSSR